MAEMTAGSQAIRQTGHTPHHHQPDPGPEPANPVGNLVTLAGAALSLTLAVGVAVWGYKILMRDVTGVPVVRAMQDEMRVAPDNPGGEIAAHTGLAVNAVPAEGGAAAPEDKLVLAPVEAPLQDEDLAVSPAAADAGSGPAADAAAPADPDGAAAPATAAAPEPRPTSETPARITPASADATEAAPTRDSLSAAEVLALADDIAADADPLSDLPEGDEAPVQLAVNGVSRTNVVDPGVPGVSNSLRPRVRPASLAPTPESARTEGAEAASAEAARRGRCPRRADPDRTLARGHQAGATGRLRQPRDRGAGMDARGGSFRRFHGRQVPRHPGGGIRRAHLLPVARAGIFRPERCPTVLRRAGGRERPLHPGRGALNGALRGHLRAGGDRDNRLGARLFRRNPAAGLHPVRAQL